VETLTLDPAFQRTVFVVMDFETTTPAGHPPQPIEVAAQALRIGPDGWVRIGAMDSLIKPPPFAPVTAADTALKGMRPEDFHTAPSPAEALGALDRQINGPSTFLLVAQNASVEANVLYHQRAHCPTLARTDLLDTIPLAKKVAPGLPSYSLDTLLAHFGIPMPANRHRAPADVDVTAALFMRLIHLAEQMKLLRDLKSLVAAAGRTARCNQPVQDELF
jgi:DNA polymerase-3 subunit epsilon